MVYDEPVQGATIQISGRSFSMALQWLKDGSLVTREGWNGKGQSLKIQWPDAHSANTLPYIYIVTSQNQRVPWVASQTDLIAEDWVLSGDGGRVLPGQSGAEPGSDGDRGSGHVGERFDSEERMTTKAQRLCLCKFWNPFFGPIMVSNGVMCLGCLGLMKMSQLRRYLVANE